MKKEKHVAVDINRLLKDALKDDLPIEAERRMKMRFAELRTKIEKPEKGPETGAARFWQKLIAPEARPWVRRIFSRTVLAYSSVFMLAVGGFLQATGHRSALAESLTSLRTSVSVVNNLRHSGFMDCRMRIPAAGGAPSEFHIRWLQPNMTRVDVRRASDVSKTLWITHDGIVIADYLNSTTQKFEGLDQAQGPIFQPMRGFLTPMEMADSLDQKWRLRGFEQIPGTDQGKLMFINHEIESTLCINIDLDTLLPTSLVRLRPNAIEGSSEEVMRIDFGWNEAVSPSLMTPETPRKNGGSQKTVDDNKKEE